MKDVTDLLFNYLEAKRHLWNVFFREKVFADGNMNHDSLDHFETIDWHLFSGLVLVELGKVLPKDTVIWNAPYEFLNVKPRDGLVELPMIVSEQPEASNGVWKIETNYANLSDAEFLFMEFFDWDLYGFVTYPYCRVRIRKFPMYPDLEGKDALIENGNIRIFFTVSEAR